MCILLALFPFAGTAQNHATDLALPDLAGREITLQPTGGRPLVLNFWAFWCDTWKAELPHLKQLAGRQPELGFDLVAISVDGTRVPEFEGRTREPLPFPVALDVGQRVSHLYHVAHVPTVIVLDGTGRVRFTHVGYPGNHVLLSELRRLTSRPAQRAR